MKRVWILLASIFLIVVLLIVVVSRGGSDSRAPRFVPGAPTSVGAFTWDHYDWDADVPFAGGKVWMWTAGGTNRHFYLYDLEQRLIRGELFNGWIPMLRSRDGARVLCQGREPMIASLKNWLISVVRRASGGKIAVPSVTWTETLWVLDFRDNSATKVGAISQLQGTGSRWHPSPSSRYGYTAPTTTFGKSFFLCDLENATARNIPSRGEPKGWWDDREIVIKSGTNDFQLLDAATGKTRALFSPSYVSTFLAEADLTNAPGGLEAFPVWNGHEYDFYFGLKDRIHGLSGINSFLLKAERTGPTLRLLYRDFAFQWGGHLDSTATRYLYQGESGKPGNGGDGAVYLRNLTNGTTVTVVPPDNKGQYAIPRFYGDEVIYFRNRLLYRIKLDGSNDTPVLSISGK